MRRIALLSLALVVLLGIFFRPWSGSEMESLGNPEVAVEEPIGEPLEPLLAATDAAPARMEVAVNEEAPAHEGKAKCVVLGRVVDEEGAPISDVPVRLQAYRVWAEGEEVPRLAGRYDMHGFEVTTDAAGAFRIEAPPPTAARTSLAITPDRFHDSYVVRFESGRVRSQPALTAGVRDLGEIRLVATGAVRGRVTNEDGRPLADVGIGVGPGRSTTYGRGTRTAADGTYLIGHAPVGTYAVKAKAEGFLSGYLEPVTVDARRDTTGIDFVLAAAPSIEGIVVDERGRPIEGAKLWGWPSSSGSGAGATSAADGRFVVYLPQDEPYTMSAQRDGYRSWGEQHDKSATFAPGTRELEIVMESIPSTRFAVVDADTGARIERFGLNILEDNGSQSLARVHTERRHPPQREHAGGIAEATARPGIDLYVVAAEGYLLATGDVAHDAPGEPLQTVRMRRGATVRGRVLRDGEAIAGARVEVEAGWTSPEGAFRPRDNTQLTTSTGAQGRFELSALRGVHRLTVTPGDGAPLVLMLPLILDQRVHDLGDLILLPGAIIAGEVLLPPGVEPAGLHVFLNDWREGVKAVIDGHGRFRFEDLAAGSHTLTLDDRPGVLASSDAVGIELAPGATLPVTLDARDRSMCAVTLIIELAGLPLAGRQVDLVSTGERRERKTLGHCDASGLVTGSVRAWGEAKVRVYLPDRRWVEHPEVRLNLQPLESVEQTVRFEFARLDLRLPAGVALPKDGTARLWLESPTPGRATQALHLSFAGGAASGASTELAHATPGKIVFGGILPGRFELTLELVDKAAEVQRIPIEGGGFRVEKPSYYRATREVVLTAGEELTLHLE